MPVCPPPVGVLDAFGASREVHQAPGGQGTSWLAGGVVLKPADGTLHRWLGQTIAGRTFDGLRVARPLTSRNGTWMVNGWTATELVEGDEPDLSDPATWTRVIVAGRRLHEAIADVPRPDFLDSRTDAWAVADRAAWGECDIKFVPELADLAERLLALPDPLGTPQVVHLDLTGNVLFSLRLPPAVIDVSPYWRPRSYAEGVVMADAMCYHGATRSHLDAVDVPVEAVARALLFRLATTNVFVTEGDVVVDVHDEARRFERAARRIGV